MSLANNGLFREFASRGYIERLAALLDGKSFSSGTLFQDILRKLLAIGDGNKQKHRYYDGEDSIFKELADALSAVNSGNLDEAAARDLAIEITRFLICFPDNCTISDEASASFLKRLSAKFPTIQKTVIDIFTKGSGFYGESWEYTNAELRELIFDTSQKIHYLVNIVGETISALTEIELTPEEITAIIDSVSDDHHTPEPILEKIHSAIATGHPISVYRNPYEFRCQPGLVGFRFYAARGRRRNKGRVYMKNYHRNDGDYLMVPIATPTHRYSEKMIEDRLIWISHEMSETGQEPR